LYACGGSTQKIGLLPAWGIMTNMRFWLTSVLALAFSTWADSPKSGSARAIGSNKEDEPAPCPVVVSTDKADLAFFRALGWAFEPAPLEVRTQAIEDLGLLGDPRALNPLAQICLDPNPALAKAAVRAIAAIRHPRAEEILSNVVRHPTVAEQTRLRALELLPYQNTWSSLRFINQTANTNASPAVMLLARRMNEVLPRRPPEPNRPPPPPPLPSELSK
jgi:HEAT repeats